MWSASSRFKPDINKEIREINNKLFRYKWLPKRFRQHWDTTDFHHICQNINDSATNTPDSETLNLIKQKCKNYTILPIDKYKAGLAVCCPKKYVENVQLFAEKAGYTIKQGDIKLDNKQDFLELPTKLKHWPYTKLKKYKYHNYGHLVIWPKSRCVFGKIKSWGDISWRPLLSYKQHFYRNLFSITCKALSGIREDFSPGFSCMDVSKFLTKINIFNRKSRANNTSRVISGMVRDIESYYPNFDRNAFITNFTQILKSVKRKLGNKRYFCIHKNPWLKSKAAYSDRWRRKWKRQRKFIWSQHLLKNYHQIHIDDILTIVKHDWEHAFLRIGNTYWFQPNGLPQGTPLGVGLGDLGASLQEENYNLYDLEPKDITNLKTRWMDDVLLLDNNNLDSFKHFLILGDNKLYGNNSKLKIEKPGKFAGLELYQSWGTVFARQYIQSRTNILDGNRIQPRLKHGLTFGFKKLINGALVGHIIRAIDSTNLGINGVNQEIAVQLKELILHEVPINQLNKIVDRLHANLSSINIKNIWNNLTHFIQDAKESDIDILNETAQIWDTYPQLNPQNVLRPYFMN